MTRNIPYYAPNYFPSGRIENRSPRLPAPSIPPMGTFQNGVFTPSDAAQRFLKQFTNENPTIPAPQIKVLNENDPTVIPGTAGFFSRSNPESITFINRKNGGLSSSVVVPHELEHYRNYHGDKFNYNKMIDFPSQVDEQLTNAFSGLTTSNNLNDYRSLYNTARDIGMYSQWSTKQKRLFAKQSFDPEEAKYVNATLTGNPIMEEETRARKAEKNYISQNYPKELQKWQSNSWTGGYPLSFLLDFNDEVISRIGRGGPLVSRDPDNNNLIFKDVNGQTTDAVPTGLYQNNRAVPEMAPRIKAMQRMMGIIDESLPPAIAEINRNLGTRLHFQSQPQ